MKKIIRLTESDLHKIVKRVLIEQKSKWNPMGFKFGDREPANQINGPIHQLQKKLMDAGFLKTKSMVPTGYFGPLTKKAIESAESSNINKKDSLISPNIDTSFKDKFNITKLSDKDSTYVCKAGQENCGQFVNDFSKKLSYVGNAWLAHDLDQVGKRIVSSYTSLTPQQVGKIFNIFRQIELQGGPKERKSGGQVENIKSLQQELFRNIPPSDFKVDDIVGIYYPPSGHHEEAFYEAGKPYFILDGKGGVQKGSAISQGKGFGMNTHIGIVGAIKNGVPLIFHNIGGDVYSDPYNKLRGGGKIMWIKRS